MSSLPLVTVVIPCYNSETTVGKAIESVLNQSYKNIELIVIDDGSTDGSLKVLKKYTKQDKRIKVIDQGNIGVGLTRQKGTDIAKGDHIYYLDADDFLSDRNSIKTLVTNIGDADALATNYFYYDDINDVKSAGLKLPTVDEPVSINEYPVTELSYVLNLGLHATLYSLKFIKNNNIEHTKSKYSQDALFNFAFLQAGAKVKRLDDIFTEMYVRENSSNSVATRVNMSAKQKFEAKNILHKLANSYNQLYYIYLFQLIHYDIKFLETLEGWQDLSKFYRESGFIKLDVNRKNVKKFLPDNFLEIYDAIMKDKKSPIIIGRFRRLTLLKNKLRGKNILLKNRNFMLKQRNQNLKERNLILKQRLKDQTGIKKSFKHFLKQIKLRVTR